jgi:hypothetical protein
MNPTNRITAARQAAAPSRQGIIDEQQFLLDKAARLASEAEAARQPPPEAKAPMPVESDAARQARLIAALNVARG